MPTKVIFSGKHKSTNNKCTYLECNAASECHVARHGQVIKFQHVGYAGKAGQKFSYLSSSQNETTIRTLMLCVTFRLTTVMVTLQYDPLILNVLLLLLCLYGEADNLKR